MKKISVYKMINIAITLFSAIIAISIYVYYYLGLCIDRCSYQMMEGLLDPLFFFFLCLTFISTIFLIFPVRYFKTWFKYILPIATILIFIHAAGVSVNTSGVLSMSRAEVVRFDMVVFGVVSAVFVGALFAREKMKKKQ